MADERKLEQQRTRRVKWRREGWCVSCGNPERYDGTKQCVKCIRHSRDGGKRNRRRREKCITLGKCIRCFSNDAAEGVRQCTTCKKKQVFNTGVYCWRGRIRLIKAMGGKCEWCGEDDIRVLEIDHVESYHHSKDKEGTWHKTMNNARSSAKVRQALIERYKAGELQILCCNCNRRKMLADIGSEQYIDEALSIERNQ